MRRLLITLAAAGLVAACGSGSAGTTAAGPLTMTLNSTMGQSGDGVTATFTGTVSPGWQGSLGQCEINSTVCKPNAVPITASSSGTLPPTRITVDGIGGVDIALRDPEGRVLVRQEFEIFGGTPHTYAPTGAVTAVTPAHGGVGTTVSVMIIRGPANANGTISLCAVNAAGAVVSGSSTPDATCDTGGGIAEALDQQGTLIAEYKVMAVPTVQADQYAIVFQTSSGVVAEAPFTVTG